MLIQLFISLLIPRALTFSLNTDLLSSPQYTLTFDSPSVNEQAAFAKLTRPNHHLLRLNGSKYLCEVPPPRNTAQSHQLPLLSPSETETEINRLSLIADDLLRPLLKECLYYTSGWWTYVYCPGRFFKQYHGIPGTFPPKPDERFDEYVMGRGSNGTVQNIDGVWNYVDRMENGDFCGLINRERSIEVLISCNPTPKLSRVKEISTCIYQASFGTPLLCAEESFRPPPPEESTNISCQKITSLPEIDEKSETASQLAKQSILKTPDTTENTEPIEANEEQDSVHVDLLGNDGMTYPIVNMLLEEDGNLKAIASDGDDLSEEEKEQLEKLKKKLEKQVKALFDEHLMEF